MFYNEVIILSIKKILLFSLLVIFIPYIIITLFIRNDEITFNFSSNTMVRVYRNETGIIERIPIEEYIVGVVAGEMPVTFSEEALKAQSVASRSYLMYRMQNTKNKDYDVVDTVSNQVYLDELTLKENWKDKYTENINKIKRAVLDTSGEYLAYDNKVIDAMFFSTSTGYTENSEEVFVSELPYLRSVSSTWDTISPAYEDNKQFTYKEFYDLLDLEYAENLNVEIIETTSTGRVKKLKINNKEFNAKDITSKLSLRSTYFEIQNSSDYITIYTKGFGHGVGMSQYGAEGMAQSGYNYKDILTHYYSGVEIKKF